MKLTMVLAATLIVIAACDRVEQGDPCDDVDCSGHGRCAAPSGTTPECRCDAGYHAEGLACVADAANADADVDGDSDGDSGTNADELIGTYDPGPGSTARRNATVHVDFLEEVDPETLLLEIDGEPVRVSTLDDRTFRFVPLPLFEPGAEVEVTVAAGVETVSGVVLDGDFSWTFLTEDSTIDVTGDPTLTEEEEDHILAGEADEPMDLVTDWEDAASRLYEISPPLDPDSAEAQHLLQRMMVSVVHHGGIGLAAPQVGINRRLFVADVGDGFEAFFDPIILDHDEELGSRDEGCLSVPGRRLRVFRPTWVELRYVREDGSEVDSRRLENPPSNPFSFPATVWLHEYDHMNGILITERASDG